MRLNRRQKRLWEMHDFSHGRGLEIGPLHNTSIRREHADVKYLDVFDRDQLLRNYHDNPGVDTDRIPPIDYALFDGERVRTIPEAVDDGTRFDWVIASHVVEHVPDIIGWLAQIAEVTVDGGHLVLVVPDRRYCFDVHRPGTTVGQLIQAHEQGDVVPSVRAVYDYSRGHTSLKARQVWAGMTPGYERRIYGLDQVQEQAARARKGEYVDAHVWTFTPGTFVEQLLELRALGLSEWRFVSWLPTRRNENEFFAVLRRLPRTGWTEADLDDEPRPEHDMPDWLADELELRRKLTETRLRLRNRRDQVKRLQAELAATRVELDNARRSWPRVPRGWWPTRCELRGDCGVASPARRCAPHAGVAQTVRPGHSP